MSRKSKIDPVLKVQLVEQYLRGEIGIREAGRLAGLSGNGTDSFPKWVAIYQNEGPSGLLDQVHNKHYPLELKRSAVNDYFHGEGSLWSFITTEDFKACELKAVNLGDDADTVGAIAGGRADR